MNKRLEIKINIDVAKIVASLAHLLLALATFITVLIY